jgi:17beta-estradiol 17-dehydrogenase / very-long-chain 3-oxoacyl-CoA reductase
LITGSSDGIGKGYARFFADLGFNLVLWSRTMSKLKTLKAELIEKYKGLDILLIAKDFGNSVETGFYNSELEKLKEIDVSILVNNVGYSHVEPKFEDNPLETIVNQININMMPQSILSNHFLQRFKSRNKDLSSAIINLSSLAVSSLVPPTYVYGASKEFNDYFSRACSHLYGEDSRIQFVSIRPGPVRTNLYYTNSEMMFKGRKDMEFMKKIMQNYMECVPLDIAQGTLNALHRKLEWFNGYGVHSIVYFVMVMLKVPGKILADLVGVFRQLRKMI